MGLLHCTAGTEHIFVGAGDGPCLVFMTGARIAERATVYPRSEPALRHGAGVETETSSSAEAYAPFPKWQPGRPEAETRPALGRSRVRAASRRPACELGASSTRLLMAALVDLLARPGARGRLFEAASLVASRTCRLRLDGDWSSGLYVSAQRANSRVRDANAAI